MSIYDDIKAHLERLPTARERKNKNRFIAWMLDKKYGSELQTGCSSTVLIEMVKDVGTFDRAWRQVLQYEPKLRGTDYGDKSTLTQEKLLELGYAPDYAKQVTELKKVVESTP